MRLLAYHGVWLGDTRFAGDVMFIKPETFAARLDALCRHGYPVITLNDAIAGLNGHQNLPDNAVVLTIDDGWYGTFRVMLPELEKRKLAATLYCDTENIYADGAVPHVLARYMFEIEASTKQSTAAATAAHTLATDLSRPRSERRRAVTKLAREFGVDDDNYGARTFDYMSPTELRKAFASPYLDIQLHTHNHSLHSFTTSEIESEIATNRNALSEILGVPAEHFKHFCYPSGKSLPQAPGILASLGIKSAAHTGNNLAFKGLNTQLLPRCLDGENLSQIEFEAELCGLMYLARLILRPTPEAPADVYQTNEDQRAPHRNAA